MLNEWKVEEDFLRNKLIGEMAWNTKQAQHFWKDNEWIFQLRTQKSDRRQARDSRRANWIWNIVNKFSSTFDHCGMKSVLHANVFLFFSPSRLPLRLGLPSNTHVRNYCCKLRRKMRARFGCLCNVKMCN